MKPLAFACSLALHGGILVCLCWKMEKSVVLPSMPPPPAQEIIEAKMIDHKILEQEVSRLAQQEADKKAKLKREEELARAKVREAEKKAQELKQKNEALKKEELAREQKIKKEKEALAKLNQEKEAALKAKQKAEAEQKAKALAEKKLAEDNAKRQADLKAKQNEVTRHALLIRNKINQNWRQPLGTDISHYSCKVAVKLLPTGEVTEVTITQSSGSVEFDRSTELAIRKASPLPMPTDNDLAKEFRQFTFTFHPEMA